MIIVGSFYIPTIQPITGTGVPPKVDVSFPRRVVDSRTGQNQVRYDFKMMVDNMSFDLGAGPMRSDTLLVLSRERGLYISRIEFPLFLLRTSNILQLSEV